VVELVVAHPLAHEAPQLGVVGRSEYEKLKEVGSVWSLDRRLGYDPEEDRKEEPKRVSGPIRRPRPLIELAVKAYEGGRITLSRFAEVMGLDRAGAVDLLEEAGVEIRAAGGADVAAESELA
jgi:predicted HTH domain antitoxin